MTEIERLELEKERIDKNIKKRELRKQQIDEQIEKLKNGKWKPKNGDEYFWIDNIAGVYKNIYDNDCADDLYLSIGNYFKSEEEAEFEVERLKVLEELKEFSYEFSDEEWINDTIEKWCIYFDYECNIVAFDRGLSCKINVDYFKTMVDAKKAIEKIGEDRLKKYYFKVGK